MKSWLKWLFETDYVFTVKHGEFDGVPARQYVFRNALLVVVKYESKNGGIVFTQNGKIQCKSVKQLIAEIEKVLA